MQNTNYVVTGGTSGIGKATANQLAKLGAGLLLIGHNRSRGEAAAAEIAARSGNDAVLFLQADLSLVQNMRSTAVEVRKAFGRLNGLIHAAGGAFPRERTLTAEGLELCFALQNLARFALTGELADLLRAAPSPKVVSVAGGGKSTMPQHCDDFQDEDGYTWARAVSRTGAINDMLTLEQTARYADITFYNYGPGPVRTRTLMAHPAMRIFFSTVGRLFSRSPEQAATDITELLTGEHPGGFYGPSLEREEPREATRSNAGRLWAYCEGLIQTPVPKGPAESIDRDLLETGVKDLA